VDALLFADTGVDGMGCAGKQEGLSARTGDGRTHADVALVREASAAARATGGVGERTPLLDSSLDAERLRNSHDITHQIRHVPIGAGTVPIKNMVAPQTR
jgi:hypothetical protein